MTSLANATDSHIAALWRSPSLGADNFDALWGEIVKRWKAATPNRPITYTEDDMICDWLWRHRP